MTARLELENEVMEFVDRRLDKELWSQEENSDYMDEVSILFSLAEKSFGKDSLQLGLLHKLSDLYTSQDYIMQQKAYKLGFRDGLNIQKVF